MNYFLAAAALRTASANALTRSAYRALTRLKVGAPPVHLDRAVWILDGLPEQRSRLLDLGTGWVHAYSLFPVLLRDDEVHCFDAVDNRKFKAFVRTVPIVLDQVRQLSLGPAIRDRAAKRAAALVACRDFDEVYKSAGMVYQSAPSGIPEYSDNYFDRVFSVDVLEHVRAEIFMSAAQTWCRIIKPGGSFLAQVGLDDHLAFYEGTEGSKRYLRYSHRTWTRLLHNEVQYINRLTASEIVELLKEAGLAIDKVRTHVGVMSRSDVHPDYQAQSDEDIRAVRLFVKAHKPLL